MPFYVKLHQGHLAKYLRFAHAFLSLGPALSSSNGRLVVLNIDSEMDKKVSEILGVSLGIALLRELMQIGLHDFHQIVGNGKRCDFKVHKSGADIHVEYKGRANIREVPRVKRDIQRKKNATISQVGSCPLYGVISLLPRNGQCPSIEVVDPPSNDGTLSDYERVSRFISYYARVLTLSGFYRFGARLEEILGTCSNVSEFRSIAYEPIISDNVFKLGGVRAFTLPSNSERISRDFFFFQGNHQLNTGNLLGFNVMLSVEILEALYIFNIDFLLEKSQEETSMFSVFEDEGILVDGNLALVVDSFK